MSDDDCSCCSGLAVIVGNAVNVVKVLNVTTVVNAIAVVNVAKVFNGVNVAIVATVVNAVTVGDVVIFFKVVTNIVVNVTNVATNDVIFVLSIFKLAV